MTVEIRRTGASDYGRYTKALICGEPGAGKTLISSTWPNPLYASAEGGLMSIADRNIPYVEIRSLDDLLRIKNSLDQPEDVREQIFGFKVETVVIDTIDEVQQIMVRERLRDERIAGMRLADWNWLSEQMGALIRGFRNLDMHVVFTCHLKETSDSDTGKTWVKPGLQGSMADKIAAYVDLALLLKNGLRTEVVEGEAKRVMSRELQTFPDPLHPWIKDRSGKLPQDLDVNFADDFERIEELIFGSVDLKEGAVSEMHELTEPEDAIAPAPEAPEPEPVKVADPVVKSAEPAAQTPEVKAEAETAAQTPEEAGGPRNQLPDDVEPKNLGHGVNIYCTVCGDEVASEEDADLSRIRHRRIMCKPCFKGVAK